MPSKTQPLHELVRFAWPPNEAGKPGNEASTPHHGYYSYELFIAIISMTTQACHCPLCRLSVPPSPPPPHRLTAGGEDDSTGPVPSTAVCSGCQRRSENNGDPSSTGKEVSAPVWQEEGRVCLPTLSLSPSVLCQGGNCNLSIADYDGRTPLHVACSEGHLELVRYLLSHGASVHVRDRFNHTPLCNAVMFK